jgi:hypothetical protein
MIFQCDLADGISGYFPQDDSYVLGNDSGIEHEYIDHDIYDGVVYKYTLVAYDYGIPIGSLSNPGMENYYIPPGESSDDVTVEIPFPAAVDYPVEVVTSNIIGSGYVIPEVVNIPETKSKHRYVVRFENNEIESIKNFKAGGLYTADGISVYDITDEDRRLVYQDYGGLPATIVGLNDSLGYDYILYGWEQLTSSFDGVRLRIFAETDMARFDPVHSGWLQGSSPMRVTVTPDESILFPWDYEIIFTDNPNTYTSDFIIPKFWRIRDENNVLIKQNMLSNLHLNFLVRNTTFGESFEGEPVQIVLLAQDLDKNGVFDIMHDRIFVSHLTNGDRFRLWTGTVFILDFTQLSSETDLPKSGDVYQVKFTRPFWRQDSLVFVVDPQGLWVERTDAVPARMELLPNYPNPFNPQTTIAYNVSRPVQISIAVYNVLGQRVATLVDRFHQPGTYRLLFKGNSLSAGLYFYSFKAGSFCQVRKMVVVR